MSNQKEDIMHYMSCGICTKECIREDLTSIELGIVKGEGLLVCFDCRMILISYITSLKLLVATSKMLGVRVGRRN